MVFAQTALGETRPSATGASPSSPREEDEVSRCVINLCLTNDKATLPFCSRRRRVFLAPLDATLEGAPPATGESGNFDYDYMREGRQRPDRLPELVAAHRAALAAARAAEAGPPMILIGKSMGGRIGCHVSLEEKVDGLICLGYPLCAMGDRRKLRDEVLRSFGTPVLFVQGTRDRLCPLDLLAAVRGK